MVQLRYNQNTMPNQITIALITDVFHQPDGEQRLYDRLDDAKSRGATLAILPELPLNPWSPATKTPRDDDAEIIAAGERVAIQSNVAEDIGIGLVGGAIIKDKNNGIRRNTALVFNNKGKLVATYCKNHLPEEPGFWETSHYEPGNEPPRVIEGFDFKLGVQICSDINRPQGCQLLGAMGAELIAAPRATEAATINRWMPVFLANAATSSTFIASVNRPGPEENGVLIGGPSVVVSPNFEVLLETTDPVATVTLDRVLLKKAKRDYPGYLPVRSQMYANAWVEIARG